MTYALLRGLLEMDLVCLYWHIPVISVLSFLDISQQYLFLDSDHSSGQGSRGDQARLGLIKISAQAALYWHNHTQAKAANSSSPENSPFLSTFYHRYKVSTKQSTRVFKSLWEKKKILTVICWHSQKYKYYIEKKNYKNILLSVGLD